MTADPLPPYDHDAPCPKCRFIAGTTQFQAAWHPECSVPSAPPDFFGRWPGFGINPPQDWYDRKDAIPEHFERACPNCKHRWAEGVIA